ncbi:MAG TPA: glycoside hydrolase family 38 C-terminal domain-containing protein [Candidatus Dormibacteraeota bacterium]|nr:glycoside hydrolase family 38 C-terminal domain-containing protein [Candidatus Dormibacteraeota bacterium]
MAVTVPHPVVPLALSAVLVRGEPISHAEAAALPFTPIRMGDAWGPAWSTTWFRVRGRVPDDWVGRRVVAWFDLGFEGPTGFTCEALAWKDGKPWRGVDPNHRWLPIAGRDVDFYLEAAANPRATESIGEPEVSMLALRESSEPAFVLREAVLTVLEADRPPTAVRPDPARMITAVGHAHIDTAWEWPLREGRRKVARSWSTQLALMDEFPDYVFAASQPAQYAWMKESYPDLYRRVREKVAAGRWEPVGGMWVEADCNLPSGEALVRQLLHGQRFFRRELGRETRILWLPDVFGYPGNLPQIMSEAGCEYFLTQKLSWNDTNKPEHHSFLWEGIDGTRVFTHFPPADTYNGDFSVDELERTVAGFKDADRSRHVLYLYGWGDGGGGPEPAMLEAAHAMDVRLGGAEKFFDEASADASGLAVVKGELYFELHRGTYTTQSRTKWWNRRAQTVLRDAEMWSVAAGHHPRETLDGIWKTVLLNQFHDILPGSSIDWVYDENVTDLWKAVVEAERVVARSMESIAGDGDRVMVLNSTSHARGGAPPCGWAVLDERPPAREPSLENEFLRIELGDGCVVTSIWDKEAGREVLSGPGNVLELHDDRPQRWDAWDLDIEHRDSFVAVGWRFGNSTVRQTITLDGRVIRFETDVDWHERHKLLKVAFPVAVSAREATYEIQFGHIRRPTHMATPQARAMFEVCAQRWADLGDGDYGVALLNDSKHGYDIHDSVMRLSLLRSPTHPDPSADQGSHIFTYALMPHPGDFRRAGVIEAAEDLNAPLRYVPTDLPAGTSRSLVEVSTRQVVVEAIKRAEDSEAVIVRLCEAWGERCTATVKTTLPASRAYLCDLLERNRTELSMSDGAVQLDLAPFKIATLKLEP